jgi:hypothetical protein
MCGRLLTKHSSRPDNYSRAAPIPDIHLMNDTIWIPYEYTSQFGLLGAMAHELHDALAELGCDARMLSLTNDPQPTTGVVLFMNTPASIDLLPQALFNPSSNMRAVQYLVDHPFALPDTLLDAWTQRTGLTNYQLMLPCADDTHLLRARFPGMVHHCIAHGLPRSALCDGAALTPEAYADRRFDVVVTGSVWAQEQIERQLGALPEALRSMAMDMAHLMIKQPWLGYVAAADLVMGSAGVITGDWKSIKLLWALVIAMVNRQRRIRTVESLQGLRVGVFGSSAWKPVCKGTIEYGGEVDYAACASAFGQGRVGVAWGPTQFVHSYSERIMQAMAGGACVVADDRLLVRRDFNGAASRGGDTCVLFDWGNPEGARAAVDARLQDSEGSLKMAMRGRAHVEARCLWVHRARKMVERMDA